ncbi:hypothetical protein [Frankia sp. AvcI1]|uniref:hypothetical protein n=1 Tax=Frankia sp. AvcI1 TaxID=573496 RepID=UPI0021181A57|nr:hypothetical protein [Frankia sp. AvcI1]
MSMIHAGRYAEVALRTDGTLAKGAAVTVFHAGSAVPAELYVDRQRSAAADNPVTVDPITGLLAFWAEPGVYDLVGDRVVVFAAPVVLDPADVPALDQTGTVPAGQLPVGVLADTIAAGNDPRLVDAEQSSRKGAPGGYAPLDAAGHVPLGYLPLGTSSGTVPAGDDPRIVDAEQTARRGHAGGYAPLDAAALLPAANLPTMPILPRQLVFYGHSVFHRIAGAVESAGFRADRLVQALCGLPDSRVTNRAVDDALLLAEGAGAGGYPQVLQGEPKTVRGAPYIGRDGTAILCWGIYDLGALGPSTHIRDAFIHALRAAISRHRAATVREHTDSTVTLTGGTAVTTTSYNSGGGYWSWTSTGGTVTITLPADFPGGTVTIGLIGAAGTTGGTISWSGTASTGTSGTTNTSAIMPAGGAHGHVAVRIPGLVAADAGKTIVGTVTALDAGGDVGLDYWQADAPVPPLTVVCGIPRLRDASAYAAFPTSVTDTDVLAWNTAIQGLCAEFVNSVVYADVDALVGKAPGLYAADGINLNELGARACATAIINAAAGAGRMLSPFQLTTDWS